MKLLFFLDKRNSTRHSVNRYSEELDTILQRVHCLKEILIRSKISSSHIYILPSYILDAPLSNAPLQSPHQLPLAACPSRHLPTLAGRFHEKPRRKHSFYWWVSSIVFNLRTAAPLSGRPAQRANPLPLKGNLLRPLAYSVYVSTYRNPVYSPENNWKGSVIKIIFIIQIVVLTRS